MPVPDFVAPMLATLVDEPFDSDRHLFEVKWDGIRALSIVADGAVRALTRNKQVLTPSFPELDPLARLPAGTLLDGELVVLADERPVFARALERMQAKGRLRVEALARTLPAQYVVFDLLYDAGRSLLARPLQERRARLAELLSGLDEPRLVFSDGAVGPGRALFEQVRARGLEGLVAKELDGAYLPGKR